MASTIPVQTLTDALRRHLPSVLRWSGAVARRLRQYNIALSGKESGSAQTDALTLADLSVQELIVAGLRDADPILQQCRIEAEETTGDLGRFATDGDYTIAIDPIDGTKIYRDRTGNGYACMILLRNRDTVLYTLVHLPEYGPEGWWVEAVDDRVACGPDDWSRPAADVVASIPSIDPATRPDSKRIYMIGFQKRDRERAAIVTAAGLEGVVSDDMPGCIFDLFGRGEFGGSLIHSPNVYDFPASLHIARILGGEAVWVHNRQPVNFHELWVDDRANMLRLPGIVACSVNPATLATLCDVAKDWSPVRYES